MDADPALRAWTRGQPRRAARLGARVHLALPVSHCRQLIPRSLDKGLCGRPHPHYAPACHAVSQTSLRLKYGPLPNAAGDSSLSADVGVSTSYSPVRPRGRRPSEVDMEAAEKLSSLDRVQLVLGA
eukprot:4741253-Prymnesium_polylepis.1